MLIGLSIMFLGVCANAVPVVGKYPLDILASFINSLLIIYGLYKNKMIEMRIMLTRGIIYSLTIVLMVFGYVYSVFALERNIQLHFGEVSQYFIIASALLMALLFQPHFGSYQPVFERFFYKTEYRQRTALMEFSLNMSHNLNLNEISQQLIDTVEKSDERTALQPFAQR
jgi:hypothetical protein